MKQITIIFSILLLMSCGSENPSSTSQKVEIPKYETVTAMLKANSDYEGRNFEVISEIPIHIRISSEFLNEDSEKTMIDQTKRDIIYVAFQTFTQSEVNEITITSIPIIRESFNPNMAYDGKQLKKLSQTKTISRKQAQIILEKYVKTKSFNDLYQQNGTLFLPNNKFDLLKYEQLDNVFNELK